MNSSDTDPLQYRQQILELLNFFFILFLAGFCHAGICFCCCIFSLDSLEDDDAGLDVVPLDSESEL